MFRVIFAFEHQLLGGGGVTAEVGDIAFEPCLGSYLGTCGLL